MDVHELKSVFADALEDWALGIVDGFTGGNPKLTMAGVYVKNGIRNYRKQKEDEVSRMIDNALLFVADEHGKVDVDKVFSDLLKVLNEMDEEPFDWGLIKGVMGKGAVKLGIPDNWLMRVLFGDKGALVIGADDLAELRKLLA